MPWYIVTVLYSFFIFVLDETKEDFQAVQSPSAVRTHIVALWTYSFLRVASADKQ